LEAVDFLFDSATSHHTVGNDVTSLPNAIGPIHGLRIDSCTQEMGRSLASS
jgi:hypothetical protein